MSNAVTPTKIRVSSHQPHKIQHYPDPPHSPNPDQHQQQHHQHVKNIQTSKSHNHQDHYSSNNNNHYDHDDNDNKSKSSRQNPDNTQQHRYSLSNSHNPSNIGNGINEGRAQVAKFSPKKDVQMDTSDKENQNSWSTPNHYRSSHPHHSTNYPTQANNPGQIIGSTIPVVPSDLHENSQQEYNSQPSSNGMVVNVAGGMNGVVSSGAKNLLTYPNYPHYSPPNQINISPVSTPVSNPSPHRHTHPQHLQQSPKMNNYVGQYDQPYFQHKQQLQQEEDLLNMGRIQEIRDRMGAERTKINEKALWKCLGAEFLGTSLLLFLGIGCVLKLEHETTKQLSFVGIALCWGFTVASIAQALGGVSADLNPAITLSFLITGRIPFIKAFMYIIMQCLGALAGTAMLKAVTPDNIEGDWGITRLSQGITPIQGCVIEIISTFMLTFTVFSVNDENRKDIKGSVPLAVGLSVAAIVCCSGPLTGASLNPARSLGPSIVAGNFDDHWIYWVGPILGAVLAGLLYTHVFRQLRPEEIEALEADEQLRQREREAKEGVGSPDV